MYWTPHKLFMYWTTHKLPFIIRTKSMGRTLSLQSVLPFLWSLFLTPPTSCVSSDSPNTLNDTNWSQIACLGWSVPTSCCDLYYLSVYLITSCAFSWCRLIRRIWNWTQNDFEDECVCSSSAEAEELEWGIIFLVRGGGQRWAEAGRGVTDGSWRSDTGVGRRFKKLD